MSTTPGNLPASPTIPLSADLTTAYQNLYDTLEAQYQATADATVREALEPAKDNVDDILTKNTMYQLNQDTALFQALAGQISDTNNDLTTLQGQIAATASHFAMAGDILGAINKVFGLLGIS
ncbi:MAG: hypothetical protein WBE72_05030 [Terracidiphilus sp.]